LPCHPSRLGSFSSLNPIPFLSAAIENQAFFRRIHAHFVTFGAGSSPPLVDLLTGIAAVATAAFGLVPIS
jgi:hypothetical protein